MGSGTSEQREGWGAKEPRAPFFCTYTRTPSAARRSFSAPVGCGGLGGSGAGWGGGGCPRAAAERREERGSPLAAAAASAAASGAQDGAGRGVRGLRGARTGHPEGGGGELCKGRQGRSAQGGCAGAARLPPQRGTVGSGAPGELLGRPPLSLAFVSALLMTKAVLPGCCGPLPSNAQITRCWNQRFTENKLSSLTAAGCYRGRNKNCEVGKEKERKN